VKFEVRPIARLFAVVRGREDDRRRLRADRDEEAPPRLRRADPHPRARVVIEANRHARLFLEDPLEAYSAVGAPDVCVELEALRGELLGTPDIVRQLQQAFEQLPPSADVDAIAKHLRTSRRSLQRRLAAADTTLSAEHKRHLLRASEKLLEHTELDLGAIAANVGASSASHLITLFRKHHAMTPGEFRRARRR
jgi:AraC-like DNA-binding protein